SNLTFGWSMEIPRELSDKEDAALDCLNHILTGTMHSRIFGKARKQGMAYGMFSDGSVGKYESSWDFGGEVECDKAERLFSLIVSELQAVLRGEITEAELEAAKSYGLGRYQMGAQTVAQISGFYTSRFFWDGYVKDYAKVPQEIKGTTLEQMNAVAREFIAANTWALAGVSSGERSDIMRLGEQLEGLFTQG
ncbi:MAG: insulinase family protein, partial [Candidatus Saccharimonas sp.]